ncbi:MAG: alcohol dehydrogenase catalytic domain-containing protein [Phycisphaeraceae bacterium]|nr:alcohol dehydrogenase catalytic domain-containing protein [Phycisphaeraceae bacterium]
MRAIRFDGARAVVDPRAEDPIPGPGEAVVRPVRMGVSAFDAMVAHGAKHGGSAPGPSTASGAAGTPGQRGEARDHGTGWKPVPREAGGLLTLGHRFVGVVEDLGEGADKEQRKRWVGKRVVGSINIVCSRCDLCRAGLGAHCRARRVLGVNGWDGCFAERFKLPLRNLCEVPREVDDDRAVFAEPLAGAVHTGQVVRVEGKTYVTVLGDGIDALLCAQVLARMNASVRLLGVRPERFGLCEKWGVKHRHAAEVGRRQDQDVVVDCTGTAAGLGLALGLVRPRGKVVMRSEMRPSGSEGGWVWGEGVDLGMVASGEVEVVGARCGSIADAVGVLARGEVDVLSLIARRGRLSDGASGLVAGAVLEV